MTETQAGQRRAKRARNQVNYAEEDDDEDDLAVDCPPLDVDMRIRQLLDAHCKEFSTTLSSKELTSKLLRDIGLQQPVVLAPESTPRATLEALGMKLPDSFDAATIAAALGARQSTPTIDVATQEAGPTMALPQWAEYWGDAKARGGRLLNVCSLRLAGTALEAQVQPPKAVRDVDLAARMWPADDRSAARPKVLLYALMSPAGSYTDFHIDFGGSCVWYHMAGGRKVFLAAPPTPNNLAAFEAWASGKRQATTPFTQLGRGWLRISLPAHHTLLLPAGWVHAVYTPEDSTAVGGNFLTGAALPVTVQVAAMEARLGVAPGCRYPALWPLLWHSARRYASLLRIGGRKLSQWELKGLPALVAALRGTLDVASAAKSGRIKRELPASLAPEEAAALLDEIEALLKPLLPTDALHPIPTSPVQDQPAAVPAAATATALGPAVLLDHDALLGGPEGDWELLEDLARDLYEPAALRHLTEGLEAGGVDGALPPAEGAAGGVDGAAAAHANGNGVGGAEVAGRGDAGGGAAALPPGVTHLKTKGPLQMEGRVVMEVPQAARRGGAGGGPESDDDILQELDAALEVHHQQLQRLRQQLRRQQSVLEQVRLGRLKTADGGQKVQLMICELQAKIAALSGDPLDGPQAPPRDPSNTHTPASAPSTSTPAPPHHGRQGQHGDKHQRLPRPPGHERGGHRENQRGEHRRHEDTRHLGNRKDRPPHASAPGARSGELWGGQVWTLQGTGEGGTPFTIAQLQEQLAAGAITTGDRVVHPRLGTCTLAQILPQANPASAPQNPTRPPTASAAPAAPVSNDPHSTQAVKRPRLDNGSRGDPPRATDPHPRPTADVGTPQDISRQKAAAGKAGGKADSSVEYAPLEEVARLEAAAQEVQEEVWSYEDPATGEERGPASLLQLHRLLQAGEVDERLTLHDEDADVSMRLGALLRNNHKALLIAKGELRLPRPQPRPAVQQPVAAQRSALRPPGPPQGVAASARAEGGAAAGGGRRSPQAQPDPAPTSPHHPSQRPMRRARPRSPPRQNPPLDHHPSHRTHPSSHQPHHPHHSHQQPHHEAITATDTPTWEPTPPSPVHPTAPSTGHDPTSRPHSHQPTRYPPPPPHTTQSHPATQTPTSAPSRHQPQPYPADPRCTHRPPAQPHPLLPPHLSSPRRDPPNPSHGPSHHPSNPTPDHNAPPNAPPPTSRTPAEPSAASPHTPYSPFTDAPAPPHPHSHPQGAPLSPTTAAASSVVGYISNQAASPSQASSGHPQPAPTQQWPANQACSPQHTHPHHPHGGQSQYPPSHPHPASQQQPQPSPDAAAHHHPQDHGQQPTPSHAYAPHQHHTGPPPIPQTPHDANPSAAPAPDLGTPQTASPATAATAAALNYPFTDPLPPPTYGYQPPPYPPPKPEASEPLPTDPHTHPQPPAMPSTSAAGPAALAHATAPQQARPPQPEQQQQQQQQLMQLQLQQPNQPPTLQLLPTSQQQQQQQQQNLLQLQHVQQHQPGPSHTTQPYTLQPSFSQPAPAQQYGTQQSYQLQPATLSGYLPQALQPTPQAALQQPQLPQAQTLLPSQPSLQQQPQPPLAAPMALPQQQWQQQQQQWPQQQQQQWPQQQLQQHQQHQLVYASQPQPNVPQQHQQQQLVYGAQGQLNPPQPQRQQWLGGQHSDTTLVPQQMQQMHQPQPFLLQPGQQWPASMQLPQQGQPPAQLLLQQPQQQHFQVPQPQQMRPFLQQPQQPAAPPGYVTVMVSQAGGALQQPPQQQPQQPPQQPPQQQPWLMHQPHQLQQPQQQQQQQLMLTATAPGAAQPLLQPFMAAPGAPPYMAYSATLPQPHQGHPHMVPHMPRPMVPALAPGLALLGPR